MEKEGPADNLDCQICEQDRVGAASFCGFVKHLSCVSERAQEGLSAGPAKELKLWMREKMSAGRFKLVRTG